MPTLNLRFKTDYQHGMMRGHCTIFISLRIARVISSPLKDLSVRVLRPTFDKPIVSCLAAPVVAQQERGLLLLVGAGVIP